MDATATRARAKTALALLASGLVVLVLLAPAAPARAQESVPEAEESAPSTEQAAGTQESGPTGERSGATGEESAPPGEDRAPAAEGGPPATAESAPSEEPRVDAGVAPVPAGETGRTDVLEPAPATTAPSRFEASPEPQLSGSAAQPGSDGPPAEQTAPPAPPEQGRPRPSIEPPPESGADPAAESRGGDRDARLLARVHERLDAVVRGVRKVRRQVDAGAVPSPPLLDELRGSFQRLRAALGELQHRFAREPRPIAGLDQLEARLQDVRNAAAALIAVLGEHAEGSPEAGALIDLLLAFESRPALRAPTPGAGQRAFHKRARPAPQAAGPAYTHTYASQAQSGSGTAPLTRPPASAEEVPASPRRSPGGPRARSGSAAAATAASFFSVAGPAALALLLGLAIPRLTRRLVELPVRRPPDRFASPPERPG